MTPWRWARAGIKTSARGLLRRLVPGSTRRIRVLTYHSVDDSGSLISVTRDELREQLAMLRTLGVRGLTASQFIEQTLNPGRDAAGPRVFLTFDDGYDNFLHEAIPLLQEFGFPATVFVVPQLMGQTAVWYKRDALPIAELLLNLTRNPEEANFYLEQMRPLTGTPLMTWEQAAHVVATGFDVASHSDEHSFLTTLTDEQLAIDLTRSRETIRDRLGVPVELICYPYGNCDERVAKMAGQMGYRIGFRVDPSAGTDPLQLGRWSVGPGLGAREFPYLFSRACDVEEDFRGGK